ncbi:type VII secretion target [Actinoplanes subtropicus]|uniref:type VII secretion target n=1 Tax=Actinoplanes subtropicus TaxID=543632 RepID=UPI0004C4735B|nr:type VII secretion target [Actinoplanes subtropicus]
MSDAFQVDSSQLYRHASNVMGVRDQLTAIKNASTAISADHSAYGMLCGWISAILEKRHAGQDSLYGYVEENLRLMADAVGAAGKEYDATDTSAQARIKASGGGVG